MGVYRKVWSCAAVAVLGLGVAAAVTVMTLASPVAGIVCLCLGVALTVVSRRLPADLRRRGRAYLSGPDSSLEVQATAALPVLAVAGMGLDTALGSAGVRVVLLVGLAGLPLLLPAHSPLTVADILAGKAAPEGDEPRRPAAPAAPRVPEARGFVVTAEPPDTGELSRTELCHAWQASYRAMLMSVDPAERARIVAARGRYLDALAEWDPDGFARWTASGTAAAGDPSAHLGGGSARPPEQE